MSRVIHTGDTHIGYRQYHVPERRADFLAAFRQVATDAVEADVDAVVHAGDLFHDRRPDLPDLLGTLRVLRRLDAADIPFLAIVGNHEGKRDAQWLDLFESLGLATRLGTEPIVVGDTAFYGLDYVPRSQRADLSLDFASHDAAHAALVAHGLFEPFDHAEWDTAALLESIPVAIDALLLGDNHDPGTAEVADTWVTYCGSTERTSADERAERGYNVVSFDSDGVRIARRGLETRSFVFVDIELGEGEGVERVRERVGQHDLADAVVVVTVAGDGEPFAPARIEEFVREQGALVGRVTDRRAVETEAELDVSFGDPDDAVRERIREIGLSPVGRDLDETVRESKVADANVRETVQDIVTDRLDDPAAFEPAETTGSSSGSATAESADPSTGHPSRSDETRADPPEEGADPVPRTASPVNGDEGEREASSRSVQDDDEEAIETATDGSADSEPEGHKEDGQVSMEEYL